MPKYNHLITLYQRDKSLTVPCWKEVMSIFVNLKNLTNFSVAQSGSVNFGNILNKAYFAFEGRYHKDINDKMRIKYQHRNFTIIRTINVDEKSKFIVLIAQEV